jgi:hypothetical protein
MGDYPVKIMIKAALGVALCAFSAPASAITFVNVITVAGDATDLSGLPANPNNTRLSFGSDLIFDKATNTFIGMSDRGPGGGLIDYAPRIQSFKLDIDPFSGVASNFNLVSTTLFKTTNGGNFTGLNPLLATGNKGLLGASLDPEGLTVLPNGNYLVADEYGPSVIEFDITGKQVRSFAVPANLVPKEAGGTINYVDGRPTIVTGRQDNRGYEGLTVSPDGTKAYAIMQDPLVNEGASNDGRRSRNLRIVEYDVASGNPTKQYVYELESLANINPNTPGDTFSATNQGRSIGVSSIMSLPDGRLVVIERDNRGVGVDDPTGLRQIGIKAAYVIDLSQATDVAGISLAGSNTLPAGVKAVSKTALLDIRAALLANGIPIAEKMEGLAFGPRLADGGLSMLIVTDNDFSVTQTGAGEQLDVCASGTGARAIFSQVTIGAGCPKGQSLIATRIYAFRLSAVEANALGMGVPEPASWAMMLAGFGMGGAMLRRRRAVAAKA